MAIIRSVQLRVVSRPLQLPFRAGAVSALAHAGLDLVGSLCSLRGIMRMDSMEPTKHNPRCAGARSRLRTGAASNIVDRAVLAGTRDVRLHAASGYNESDFAGNRRGSISVGCAALDLSAHVHSRLRTSALVPARVVRRCSRRFWSGSLCGPGCCRRAECQSTTRHLSTRAVHRVHGLPRRTGALASLTALPDGLLSCHRDRRRTRRRIRRPDRSERLH